MGRKKEDGTENILVCWVGNTDIKTMDGAPEQSSGPIRALLAHETFDMIHLISSGIPDADRFAALLRGQGMPIELHEKPVPDPIDYRLIYDIELDMLKLIRGRHGTKARVTVHLSPGTPTMTACWILLSRLYGTRLVQTIDPRHTKTGETAVKEIEFPNFSDFSLIERDSGRNASGTGQLILACQAIRHVHYQGGLIARCGEPILLTGETGTGKEELAHAIHERSGRSGGFVAVNCGAIPENLFASEFFGHKRGAFTGADRDRAGYFKQAEKGTLFLDEIGDLPQPLQVGLLRVLQDRKYRPLGHEGKEEHADVRIISATNKNLLREVKEGRFREDLFYRIALLQLRLPSLSEYGEGVSELMDHFLKEISQEQGQARALDEDARDALLARSWPGNIRELRMAMRRLYLMAEGQHITREAVLTQLPMDDAQDDDMDLGHLSNRPLGDGFSLNALVEETSWELRRRYLQRAMALAAPKPTATRLAYLLGVPDYHTIQQWGRQLGMPIPGRKTTDRKE